MLSKRKLAAGKVRVTFSSPPLQGVEMLYLVGDFNQWSTFSTPMTANLEGGWSIALTLDAGRKYAFRYFAVSHGWLNDWAADDYAPNEFGCDNSVVNLESTDTRKVKPEAALKSKVITTKSAQTTKAPEKAKKPAVKKPAAKKAAVMMKAPATKKATTNPR